MFRAAPANLVEGVQHGVCELALPRDPLVDDRRDDRLDRRRQPPGFAAAASRVRYQRRRSRIRQKSSTKAIDRGPVDTQQLGRALGLFAPHGTSAQRPQHASDLDLTFADLTGRLHPFTSQMRQ